VTSQVAAEGNLLTSNPETCGQYHSSWLSMMYTRLFLARQLLSEDGVVFVSIAAGDWRARSSRCGSSGGNHWNQEC
jgi:adenine-specific DNA-methyltransferase